ncbi:RNA polymerase sigma-70 factor, ECF subfamily [Sphingomonas gellani]|uniref:RNA polymerase sigma-70 factor, ECF subfamily n=1 Tax=Sphingomonas gellani TaxID=1166340 RepID=A0A1H8H7I3_9SPHN|nr:RNA polymerase sigma factor [Sphingomonas gellani]SEN52193.1 RNA polymerase sigma-70 factor, ECF subfamily [Sphingomonas gellani]
MTPPAADRGDGDLVARAMAGDDPAFAALVSRHKQALHRLVARIIGDEDEAVDVVQDVFVAAHGALARYDPARPLRAWLARIAINKARDWRRRRLVRRLVSAVFPDNAAEIADRGPAVDTVVAGRLELARVGAAMARLPANLREVLVLRTVEGFSQAEAAQALGIVEKAVETRLYRARQRLRIELDRDRGPA